jgi:hypothetical protein
VVHEVAGGEHARAVGARGLPLGDHVAVLVDVDLAAHQLGLGHVADGDERARHLQVALLFGVDVAQPGVAERAVVAGHELVHHVGREELDVVGRARPLEHDLRGPELRPAVDHRDLPGELGEEDRLLHGRVAAAHDHGVAVLEEGGVAGGAVGDPAAAQLLLAWDDQLAVLGAHGQDHGLGAVLGVAHPHLVHPTGLGGQLDARGLLGDQAGAEALGLAAEVGHHLRAHDPVGVARVVLHVGRLLEQPAPGVALDHQRLEVGARRVERRRVARRAAADDDDVLALHFV